MPGCCKKYLLVCCSIIYQISFLNANAQQPVRPPITGIAYVQLQVSDSKKAAVFYQALMGYAVTPAKAAAGSKDKYFSIRINQRQTISLKDGLPAGQDERLLVLALQTTDAASMRDYLQSKGLTVPAGVNKDDDKISFTVTDPDNHPISFVQYLTNAKIQTQPPLPGNAISRRILHAGLTIANAKTANTFYADVLGFSEIWRGGSNDSITSWINMRVPEGTDYLEYMLVNGPVSRQQLGSLHHIALMVPDMQAAVDLLTITSKKTGYLVAAPRIGRNNRWQLNLFDPDGTRIELMEPFPMR